MAIELPDELVWVMQLLGLPWISVDEDQVRDLAKHVREFGTNLSDSHATTEGHLQDLAAHYQAGSYDQLLDTWAQMSTGHMQELIAACHFVADGLDYAADAVVAAKGAVIGELIAMAAEFVADQAAAALTFGAAEAIELVLVEATKKIVNGIVQQLEQEIIAELIDKAVGGLEEKIGKAVEGMVFKGVVNAVGV